MATTGRTRLTLVTALTVASLLVGSTAINALADHGRDGGGHGNGDQGKPGHAQVVQDQHTGGGGDNRGGATDHARGNRPSTTTTTTTDTPVMVSTTTDVAADTDDLVTQPAQETGEERPGLGCGDDNHVHTGPPGNPSKECRGHGDDDGGMGAATDDDGGGDGGDGGSD